MGMPGPPSGARGSATRQRRFSGSIWNRLLTRNAAWTLSKPRCFWQNTRFVDDAITFQRPAPAELARFLHRLRLACQRIAGTAPADDGLGDRLLSLLLAEAALRYCEGPWLTDWGTTQPPRPFQVAVLGPTQTGKSTVVNLLLGCAAAQVSPLAGFTVHPQGFANFLLEEAGWIATLLPGWRRCAVDDLPQDCFEAYALTSVARAAQIDLPPCVLWDTPDFDSLAARRYVAGVLEVAALADIYLLVLSKEKYSDLSVWRLLDLLAPLGRPLVICLNKLPPDDQPAIVRCLRQRLEERGRCWGEVPLVAIPYEPALATGELTPAAASAERLRSTIATAVGKLDSGCRRTAGVRALLGRHWEDWLAPLQAEHAACEQWREAVRQLGDRFLSAYTRDYLDHPQRCDTFRRAAVELLELLEIPRVGRMVAQVRRVVTWPLRQVLLATRSRGQGRRLPTTGVHSLGAEAAVLIDTLDSLLTGLQRDVLRRGAAGGADAACWRALGRLLESELPRLRAACEQAICNHHQRVQAEVRAAAGRLYAELQQHPARLNTLRTARATLDVGSLLLVAKTGGLTGLDVVWAPATFALTSLLMELLAGLELDREARRLKARQHSAVREEIVEGVLLRELSALTDRLTGDELWSVGVDELLAAEAALRSWNSHHDR